MSRQAWSGSDRADEVRELLKKLMDQNAAGSIVSGEMKSRVAEPVPPTIPLREEAVPPPPPAPSGETPEHEDDHWLPYLRLSDEEEPGKPARRLTGRPAAKRTAEEDAYTEDPVYAPRMAPDTDEEDEEELPMPELPLVMPEWTDAEEKPVSEPEEGNDLPLEEEPPAPRVRRNPLAVIGGFFAANFPRKGDGAGEWIRKCVFWLALAVLVVSLGYILYQIWWLPARNAQVYDTVAAEYRPDAEGTVSGDYPAGMLASFRELYDQNHEVRGFLDFSANSQKDFLNIHYPVMYSGDNSKYLYTDFYGNRNKNGTLFFDERNVLEPDNHNNKVLIVYGHNMASGQMFAGLNKLIGNLQNARSAATLTLSTLYEKSEYKVFAVVLSDEEEEDRWYYDCRQTYFATNGTFLEHVDALRARSLFDYPVDVIAGDQLLVLSTCTAYSSSKLHDGRLMVIARKVRSFESSAVDASAITRNEDVIMPRAWYTNQKLTLHPYYTETNYTVSEKRYTTSTVPLTQTLPEATETLPATTGTLSAQDATGTTAATPENTTTGSLSGTTGTTGESATGSTTTSAARPASPNSD